MLILKSINNSIIYNNIFLYFSIYVGYIGHILLGEFSGIEFRIKKYLKIDSIENLYLRNTFFFRALPHFMLGIFIKLNNIKLTLRDTYYIILFIFGSILSSIEYYIIQKGLITYLGTFFQVISLICFCTSSKQRKKDKFKFIYIGRKLSDKVYIYHIAIKKIIILINMRLHLINKITLKWTLFLILTTVTLLFCLFIEIISDKLKNNKT